MGTSSSGGGAGNKNPLIPSWIPSNNSPQQDGPPNNDDGKDVPKEKPNDIKPSDAPKPAPRPQPIVPNRFTPPRREFNKYVSSGGSNRGSLRKALKGYSRNAAGNTSNLAHRMAPSTSRVAGFAETINTIKRTGLDNALQHFSLSNYNNKPLVDILSALCDEVFKDTGKAFENTQDDSITKQAYANTVVRICEEDGIDINNLSNENVEVMIAIFIEETIAQRVINDIGNNMTKKEADVSKLLAIENNVYQMVNGLVRNEIMPEIIATQRGDKESLEKNIENVYRTAFDVLSNLND